jgi:DNA polymerase elongation subunit (family B)
MPKEQYLVFDIETASIPIQSFSESQQEYLVRGAKTEEEKQDKIFKMGLSPLTAKVVTIGLLLFERDDEEVPDLSSISDEELLESKGWKLINKAAFVTDESLPDGEMKTTELSDGSACVAMNEKTVIAKFWDAIRKYNNCCLVSFNGRNFDAPFLMMRSALFRVRPSRNLMQGTKFNYRDHIDLIDELTFFSGSFYGATRRYNFDFFARAFGIVSPKAEGVDGSMVTELYENGEIETIAEYCLRDVTATWQLYLLWDRYLRF